MITVHRNGTKTTFRHYRIQDIARLLGTFFCRWFFWRKYHQQVGGLCFVNFLEISVQNTDTHTHSGDTSTHAAMPFVWQQTDANCGSSIRNIAFVASADLCWSIKSANPFAWNWNTTKSPLISCDFKSPYSTYLHVETSKTGSISSWTTLW